MNPPRDTQHVRLAKMLLFPHLMCRAGCPSAVPDSGHPLPPNAGPPPHCTTIGLATRPGPFLPSSTTTLSAAPSSSVPLESCQLCFSSLPTTFGFAGLAVLGSGNWRFEVRVGDRGHVPRRMQMRCPPAQYPPPDPPGDRSLVTVKRTKLQTSSANLKPLDCKPPRGCLPLGPSALAPAAGAAIPDVCYGVTWTVAGAAVPQATLRPVTHFPLAHPAATSAEAKTCMGYASGTAAQAGPLSYTASPD